MNKTLAFVAMASILGLVAYVVTGVVVMRAYGETSGKGIVLFLLQSACRDSDKLEQQFPDATVYCTHDSSLMIARSHLSGFETMYHVVYVSNTQSWGITMHDYSYSLARPWSVEIRHELEHQYCKCFYTADGMHGSPQTGAISGVIVN